MVSNKECYTTSSSSNAGFAVLDMFRTSDGSFYYYNIVEQNLHTFYTYTFFYNKKELIPFEAKTLVLSKDLSVGQKYSNNPFSLLLDISTFSLQRLVDFNVQRKIQLNES